jgi:hypothetical protein
MLKPPSPQMQRPVAPHPLDYSRPVTPSPFARVRRPRPITILGFCCIVMWALSGLAVLATGLLTASMNPIYSEILTSAQLRQIVDAAQRNAGGRMNSAQMDALSKRANNSGEDLVTSPDSSTIASAFVGPNGDAVVTFDIGTTITFSPSGQILSTTFAPPGLERFLIPVGALLLLISLGLGALLLFAGISVLRGWRSTLRLFYVYAAVKIPVGIATGVVVGMFDHAVVPRDPAMPLGIILSCLGIIFPVGLLVVGRMRTVQDYFGPGARCGGG